MCAELQSRESLSNSTPGDFTIRQYAGETELEDVMLLVDAELSEPYSIFTYRYFLQQWPHLSFMAVDTSGKAVGAIVCKADAHGTHMRGYIAMVVVEKTYRGKGLGRYLVRHAIEAMVLGGCEEVVLEAEVTNSSALKLYEGMGFLRDKRLHRYYLSGNDAYRLKLLLPLAEELPQMEDFGLRAPNLPPLPASAKKTETQGTELEAVPEAS